MTDRSPFPTPDGLEELRVTSDLTVESRSRKTTRSAWSAWSKRSKQSLLVYPVGSEVWGWLNEQGIQRPSPSGKGGRRPSREERLASGLVYANFYLPGDVGAELEELAGIYGSKTAAVSEAIHRLAAHHKKK